MDLSNTSFFKLLFSICEKNILPSKKNFLNWTHCHYYNLAGYFCHIILVICEISVLKDKQVVKCGKPIGTKN